jgi:hemerythrin superfamily protein
MFGLTNADSTNAIDLLKRDHDEVEDLFKQFEASEERDTASRGELAMRICAALAVHAEIEEELFYPALRRGARDAADLLDEAAVEHQSLKDIIERLRAASPSDPLFNAGVKVLSEYVKHHVHEEEDEIFPKAKTSDVDLDKLGARMAQRKDELTAGTASAAASTTRGKRRVSSNGKGIQMSYGREDLSDQGGNGGRCRMTGKSSRPAPEIGEKSYHKGPGLAAVGLRGRSMDAGVRL